MGPFFLFMDTGKCQGTAIFPVKAYHNQVHPGGQPRIQQLIHPPDKRLPHAISTKQGEFIRGSVRQAAHGPMHILLCIAVFQSVVKPGHGKTAFICLHLRDALPFLPEKVLQQLFQAVRPVHANGAIGIESAAFPLVDIHGTIIGTGRIFEAPSETPHQNLGFLYLGIRRRHQEISASHIYRRMGLQLKTKGGAHTIEYPVVALFLFRSVPKNAVSLHVFNAAHCFQNFCRFLCHIHAL